jgi:putative ABC transport system permease protein
VPDLLKVVVGDRATGRVVREPAQVEAVAADLVRWLGEQGRTVHGVDVPPYRHPHQNQTDTITGLFLGFAVATLVLAAVLVATTLGGMLAGQTRQIGALKTVGATNGQVLRMYLAVPVGLSVLATLLAVGPALVTGQGLVGLVAGLLNIDVASRAVPARVWVALAAAGLAVPVLVALVPLTRAARMSVRSAIDDHGADARAGTRRSDRWVARVRLGGRTDLALRNVLRRRTRLALTLALLATGGALFGTGLNTARAWQAWVDQGLARRAYTAELHLARPAPADAVRAVAAKADGVTLAEPVRTVAATPATAQGRVEVSRTYPDGGHGRFVVTALPPGTRAVSYEVLDGRWLAAGDTRAAVLNQGAAARLADPAVGSDVRVAVEGRVSTWRVVGVVAEVGGPATVYTSDGGPSVGDGAAAVATAVRVRTTGDPQAGAERVAAALADAGYRTDATTLSRELRSAVDEHVVIFVDTLVALALLMAVVGVLGLASAMTISVTERTREYGVLQTLGAGPGVIRRLVLGESVAIGLLGGALGVVAALPLSRSVERLVGELTFDLPLPFTVSASGVGVWAVLAVAGAAAAGWAAASRASRLTIRDALAHL